MDESLGVLDDLVARYPDTELLHEVQFRRGEMLFLRKRYDSDDALIDPAGLQGEFERGDPLAYSTSTPAAVVIYADTARVEIVDSSIAGQLNELRDQAQSELEERIADE